MSNVKTEVIAMIQGMPEETDIPDIMAELYFRQKVDRGLEELEGGEGIPHDTVKGRLEKWLN